MTTAVSDSKKRMVNLVASFPWVNDPGKACKILWDTLQCLLRKSLAGTLAGGHFLVTLSHIHLPRQLFHMALCRAFGLETPNSTLKEFVFVFICEQVGGVWPVALAGFLN